MTIRATSPAEEAATAARECWQELSAGSPVPGDLWRQVAMAAVVACDRAQPRRPHVPLFIGEQVELRWPVHSCRARVLYRWLQMMQRRHPA